MLTLPHLSFFWLSFHFSRGQNRESRPRSFFAPKQHGNACYGYAGYYLARTLAYKSISILSGARSASGRLFMFSAVKANERARAFALGPRGGGGTPIHYLYEYVPPNGVVILKLLI